MGSLDVSLRVNQGSSLMAELFFTSSVCLTPRGQSAKGQGEWSPAERELGGWVRKGSGRRREKKKNARGTKRDRSKERGRERELERERDKERYK